MNAREQWWLETIQVVDCVEWHAANGFTDHGVAPGYAVIEGESRVLRFAPHHLLAINHKGATPELAEAAGAIGVEVTGKWLGYRLNGSHTHDVLAAGAHVELVLNGRTCAALPLFDCPVVLLRTERTNELWVHASYADSLRRALNMMEEML